MATEAATPTRRLRTALREDERVSPLELFFDLVFVLAITQCTQLMFDNQTWEGLAQGLLVLALLWWSWMAYAWLTSVVDPEDDAVRISIFAAMAALLIVSLAVPEAFGDRALTFAVAYGVVRAGQIALFVIASRDDAALRQSVAGLAVEHRARCRPADRRGVDRRHRAGCAVGARAGPRHGRPLLLRRPRAGSSCPGISPSATG